MSKNKVLADFALAEGEGSIRIEVPKPSDESGLEEVSIIDDILQAPETFEAALSKVQPVIDKVARRLKAGLTTPANEVEVKFGLNLSVESGVIISSVGGGVNFEVTLKWNDGNSAKQTNQSEG